MKHPEPLNRDTLRSSSAAPLAGRPAGWNDVLLCTRETWSNENGGTPKKPFPKSPKNCKWPAGVGPMPKPVGPQPGSTFPWAWTSE